MQVKRIIFFAFLITLVDSKQYTKCEFIQALVDAKVENIEDHICAALGEDGQMKSSNLKIRTGLGIYRIASQWWCGQDDTYSGSCRMPCSHLTDDDIKDDIKCASQILREQGLAAWRWGPKCEKTGTNDDCKIIVKY